MKTRKAKYFLLSAIAVLSAAVLLSCATTEKQESLRRTYDAPVDFSGSEFGRMLETSPSDGSPRFFAYTGRMKDRDQEAVQCVLNAAEQASRFTAVKAVAKFYSEKVNSSIKYMRDLEVHWDRDLAVEMIDSLTVREIIQDTYGTYLVADLEGAALQIPYVPEMIRSEAPSWTISIPEIPGYRVSVGIALQTGYVADSFRAADDQALEDLARQVSVEIFTGRKSIENARGTASIQTNLEISKVIIAEFYILDRWRSPDGRYYYSLAAAPVSKSIMDD